MLAYGLGAVTDGFLTLRGSECFPSCRAFEVSTWTRRAEVDPRIFPTEAGAKLWLEDAAAARGFATYELLKH